jgi:hypothetical protein
MRRAELGRDLVVGAHQSRPGCAGDEPIEGEEQGFIRAVELEMIRFDVREHDGFARQLDERAVALVGLHHEPSPSPQIAAAISFTSPPMMNDGCKSAWLSTRASIEEVVVFPCVPATATVRRGRDGREHVARRNTGTCRSRGHHFAIPFGYRGRDRHEVEIDQVVRTVPDEDLDAFGARRSRPADSLRSLPETLWPMAVNTLAIALMPAPPTPTTWIERGLGQIDGLIRFDRRHRVDGLIRHGMFLHQPGDTISGVTVGRGLDRIGHRRQTSRVGQQRVQLLGQASRSARVGHEDGSPARINTVALAV